jgi:hypothetical protein
MPITQYVPGQQYTARVTITATGSSLSGYGFQMIGLRDSDNSDLDGFIDINPNNYKLATIPNGRTYAEHNNRSSANTFNVTWTAPPTGTGSVTFYASGNGVNGNGTTSGDGAGFSSLKLTEQTSSANDLAANMPKARVSPNPIQAEAILSLENLVPDEYRISAFDVSGNRVWETRQNLPEASPTLSLPSADWVPGVYFLRLESGKKVATVKVLKL